VAIGDLLKNGRGGAVFPDRGSDVTTARGAGVTFHRNWERDAKTASEPLCAGAALKTRARNLVQICNNSVESSKALFRITAAAGLGGPSKTTMLGPSDMDYHSSGTLPKVRFALIDDNLQRRPTAAPALEPARHGLIRGVDSDRANAPPKGGRA